MKPIGLWETLTWEGQLVPPKIVFTPSSLKPGGVECVATLGHALSLEPATTQSKSEDAANMGQAPCGATSVQKKTQPCQGLSSKENTKSTWLSLTKGKKMNTSQANSGQYGSPPSAVGNYDMPSGIPSALQELEQQVTHLQSTLEVHEDRLQPVLLADERGSNKVSPVQGLNVSAFGAYLQDLAVRVEGLRFRIQALTSRLDF